ncbi:MAG: hypothetical protein COV76_00565 [Candidatus Omnitrophica bacterium CG11_big_fil_rev_8_21_14_0_20_64_10]|nr:MAG: hypothetical protein COV76_00565 [Candidatus Omnitrophica bacterium CG11_big_fil_rev_8_21_14_0_20_64_10]
MTIAAALLITGMVVLMSRMTMRRFESASFRSDRLAALNLSEAGTRYAWARLSSGTDTLAADAEAAGDDTEYIIASATPSPVSGLVPDETDPMLRLNGREIEVRVIWQNPDGTQGPALPNGAEFEVHVYTDYGYGPDT